MSVPGLILGVNPIAYYRCDDASEPLVNSGSGGATYDLVEEATGTYTYAENGLYLNAADSVKAADGGWWETSTNLDFGLGGTDPQFVIGAWIQSAGRNNGSPDVFYMYDDGTTEIDLGIDSSGRFDFRVRDTSNVLDVFLRTADGTNYRDGDRHLVIVWVTATEAFMSVDGRIVARGDRVGGSYTWTNPRAEPLYGPTAAGWRFQDLFIVDGLGGADWEIKSRQIWESGNRAPFIGKADDPIVYVGARGLSGRISASDLLPSVLPNSNRDVLLESAFFDSRFGSITISEGDDSVAASGSQPLAGYVSFTEGADAIAASGIATPVGNVAYTEGADTAAAAGISGSSGPIAFTEGADVVAGAAFTFSKFAYLPSIDGGVEPIGPLVIFADDVEPPVLYLPSIDGASVPTGPRLRKIVTPGTWEPDGYAELYDSDGVTLLSSLPLQFGLRWQDPENDVGSGTISLPLVDASGNANADVALLVPGRFVRCYLYGLPVFTWRIEGTPTIQRVTDGEEVAEIVTASGRGWVSVFDEAVVYPAFGLDNPISPTQRFYSFASPELPPARTANWNSPGSIIDYSYVNPQRYQPVIITTEVDDGPDIEEYAVFPAPLGFPVPSAQWIWGHPDTSITGRCYFRRAIYISAPGAVQIFVTADNFYTLYLNGTPILGENEDSACWRGYRQLELTLPEGVHVFAAVVENLPWYPEFPNPAGFLFAMIPAGEDGGPEDVIVRSDNTWLCLAYPPSTPGWTVGEILGYAIAEPTLRGAIPYVSYDFTTETDSAGNPWPIVPGFSVPVGSTLLGLLNALTEEGWIDWRMKPGTPVLQAWNRDTARAAGPTFTKGANILDLQWDKSSKIVNALLVKWDGGYFRLDDAASQAIYDVIEGTFTVRTGQYEEALRRAQQALAYAADDEASGVATILPASDAHRPYIAFGPRDTITLPGPTGTPAAYPVRSISVGIDNEGTAEVVLEVNRRLRVWEREVPELIASLGSGVKGQVQASDPLVSIRPMAEAF